MKYDINLAFSIRQKQSLERVMELRCRDEIN